MSYTRNILIAASLFFPGLLIAQPLAWMEDLPTAQQLAARKQQPMVIFFTARDSIYAKGVEEWLTANDMHAILDKAVLVRLYLSDQQELAGQLGVYRAGTVLVYRSDGSGVSRMTDIVTGEELKTQLTRSLETANPAAEPESDTEVTSGPSKTQSTLAAPARPRRNLGPVTKNSQYLELAKGPQVGQTITRNANDGTTVTFAKLQKEEKYVLQLKGVYGNKTATQNGSDPIYNFYDPSAVDVLTTSTLVRFVQNNTYIALYLLRHKIPLPPYTTAHTYDIPITGEGKELKLRMSEKTDHDYTDNTGSVSFALYEAGS